MGWIEWYATGLWFLVIGYSVITFQKAGKRKVIWGELNSSQICKALRK